MTIVSDIGISVMASGGVSWNAALSIPSAVTLTVVNDTQINVAFTINGTGQDGHKVYISTDGINYTLKGTVTGSTATYSATGLTAGTNYSFYVKAYKGSQESPASNVANATTISEGEIAIRAGNTVGWYDFAAENVNKDDLDNFNYCLDKILGSSSLGEEQSSGNVVQYNFCLITATTADYFFAGNQVGDIFVQMPVVKALDATHKVRYLNGVHIGQPIAANRPLWTNDGLLFNGVNQGIGINQYSLPQPTSVYLVLKQITWTGSDRIFTGAGWGTESMILSQRGSTPEMQMYAGTWSGSNNNCTLDTWAIIRVVFNGASSSLQINNTTVTTGDFGSTAAVGFNVGYNYNGTGGFANIKVKEIILRNIADDAATQTKIYNYLSNKYGVGGALLEGIVLSEDGSMITDESGNLLITG